MVTGRRKLLLADDSIAIQKVVSLSFTDEGMDVATVSDGNQALDYLRENPPPDIVLADCFMPGLNGYELCERIKTDNRWRHIPVLLLVSIFEPYHEAEARRVGADDVLTKPFQSIRDLMNKVGSMLGGGKAGEEPAAEATSTRDAAAAATARRDAGGEPPSDWGVIEDTAGGGAPQHAYHQQPDPASSFADLGMDDQMIESKPAENFGHTEKAIDTDELDLRPSSPPADVRYPEVSEEAHGGGDEELDQWSGALKESSPAYVAAQDEIGEETLMAQPAVVARAAAPPVFAPPVASADSADDALLDLGEIEPAAATAEDDDFVLDLSDEMPAASALSLGEANASSYDDGTQSQSPGTSGTDAAGAFAEAAHGETSRTAPPVYSSGHIAPTVELAEAPLPVGMEGSRTDRGTEGDVARPPLGASGGSAPAGAGGEGQVNLHQLSDEVLDDIARRAVERLSEQIVQEIAWEVVPQLAELMIKRRLDEERKK